MRRRSSCCTASVPIRHIGASSSPGWPEVNPLDRNAAIIAKALPNCRLEILQGYGHLPEIEAPEQVNVLLHAFLAD